MSALAELSGLERGAIVIESGLTYGDGEPVEVLVRTCRSSASGSA